MLCMPRMVKPKPTGRLALLLTRNVRWNGHAEQLHAYTEGIHLGAPQRAPFFWFDMVLHDCGLSAASLGWCRGAL
jgi:hypothetical protein